MAGVGEPEPIHMQSATPNFFALLGAKPVLGRIFLPEEAQDRTQTILISNSFWKRKFNSDPNVLGKTLNVGGLVSTIVGVMPPSFTSSFYGGALDLWEPVNPESARYSERIDHWLMPVGRLKPGVTLQQAQLEMDVIARRLELAYPATNKGIGKRLMTLHEELFGWARNAIYPLVGAVAFVLLIACVNVANLLQSRTETRRKEYALRLSLGAGRRRLIQQLLVESALLALLGGAFGVAFTFAGIPVFRALAGDFPNASKISVDATVLLFTLSVSLGTALLFGLAPAIQASRPNLERALREGGSRTATTSRGLIRHSLAVCEIALSMVLLIGSGLMINTMLRLQRVDPGLDPHNVLTVELQLPEGGKYEERVPGGDMERALPTVTAFWQQLLAKTAALPAVESVGISSAIPMRGSGGFSFSILGHPAPSPDQRPRTAYAEISPGFFRTLKIPLRKGRYLDEHDNQAAPWALVVNETFAHRYFPNEDPIGQQVLLRYGGYEVDEDHPRQIVGVVGDVKQNGLGRQSPPFVYACYLQQPPVFPGGAISPHLGKFLVLRTVSGFGGAETQLTSAVKKVVEEIDPDQPITSVMSMDRVMDAALEDSRFYMQILGIFSAFAVLLALIGIYGVMSYFVNERTHEIGIRVALGAQRGSILSLVTKLGLKLALIGVAIGIGLALLITRLITQLLYGVKPTDPTTYAAVGVVLIGAALLACYLPARRATKVDPITALRHE